MARSRQRARELAPSSGVTLVELMIAMAIAGILIGLIFAIYTRMSVSYQVQGKITTVTQNMRAGLDRIVRDLRMAGNQFPSPDFRYEGADPGPYSFPPSINTATWNGVKVSTAVAMPGQALGQPLRAVYVENGGGREADTIRYYYADTQTAAKVINFEFTTDRLAIDLEPLASPPNATTDAATQFSTGQFVIIVNSRPVQMQRDLDGDLTLETFERTDYEACLLQVSHVFGPNLLHFHETGVDSSPFNAFGARHHCLDASEEHTADITRPISRADTMLYPLVGRGYRIDPARRATGVLQFSPTGVLTGADWTDLGIGFTNLQFATQFAEDGDITDADSADATVDPFNRPDLDWYSGDAQEHAVPNPGGVRPDDAVPVKVSITVESRSNDELDTVPTTALPDLQSTAAPNNNTIGDAPAMSLPDGSDLRYQGNHIFRWTTVAIDLRNSGVAR